MKRSILNRIFLLGIIITGFAACKTKKVVVVAPAVVKVDTDHLKKTENLQFLKSKNISFNTLSLKGKAQISMNGNTNNVSVGIRIQKDKKIWISMTAFAGMEVARALLTHDSILVINRIQNVYLAKPFNYVHTFTNKEVNFNMLEDVLAGNAIRTFLTEDSNLDLENGVWQLKGEKNNLAYQILFNTLLKAAEVNLNDVNSARALKVVYGDYQQIENYLFPSTIQISSESGVKRVSLNLDFSKIEANVPLDFNFSVPKRFQVIN